MKVLQLSPLVGPRSAVGHPGVDHGGPPRDKTSARRYEVQNSLRYRPEYVKITSSTNGHGWPPYVVRRRHLRVRVQYARSLCSQTTETYETTINFGHRRPKFGNYERSRLTTIERRRASVNVTRRRRSSTGTMYDRRNGTKFARYETRKTRF